MKDEDHPRSSCDDFTERRIGKTFRIQSRRVDPYRRIAVLLAALHKAFKELE